MKASICLKTIFLAMMYLASVTAAYTQDATPPDAKPQETPNPIATKPPEGKQNLLLQLGLSREQIQQIRRLNVERKPMMEDAQRRFREANRALDEAIYADQVNDIDVQSRLKDVQVAQAEVANIRYTNELSVRKILTTEQLVRFRELRQKFEMVRRATENQRPNGGGRVIGQRPAGTTQPLRALREKPPSVRQVMRQNQQRPKP